MLFLFAQPPLDVFEVLDDSDAAAAVAIFSRFHDPNVLQGWHLLLNSFVFVHKLVEGFRVFSRSYVVGLRKCETARTAHKFIVELHMQKECFFVA
jgi:hypothetical protein